MLGRSRWIVAVALILVSSSVYAQRGGGRGGMGRGMGGSRMGRVLSPVEVIGSDAVQKEVGLSDEQKTKVKVIVDEFREKLQEAASDFRGLRDLPEEERREKFNKLRAKMTEHTKTLNAEFKPKLAAVIDATQMERLEQIARQAAGPMALEDPDVQKNLQLTKEQQEKIDSLFKEGAKKRAELFAQGRSGNPRERMEKMRELDKAREKEVAEVLTSEQKDKLEKMRGKPFDISQMRVSGGNRRSGPRGERPERPAKSDAADAEKPSGEKPEDSSK